jgi:hypothetical protein
VAHYLFSLFEAGPVETGNDDMRFWKVLRFISLFFLFSFLFACSPASSSNEVDNTGNPSGRIASAPLCVMTTAEGPVLVQKPGENGWQNGEIGMSLGIADRIKTETGGRAALTFFDGSTIELDEGTEISLKELDSPDQSTRIKIQQDIGRTFNRVKKLADPASCYEIETTAAVAGVRGTEFWVHVLPDGTTVVSNISGVISIIAQGVEIILQPGMQSTIVPGQPPGQPVANNEPAISPVVSTTPPPTSTTPSDTRVAGINAEVSADRLEAFPGDTLIFTALVGNAGDLPLSVVVENRLTTMKYVSGDSDNNGLLATSETWTYSGQYLVQSADVGQLVSSIDISGTGEGNRKAVDAAAVTVNIRNIMVEITSLQESQTVMRDITVAGTVNDLSITQATITVNGASRLIPVVKGNFNTSVSLADGVNVITVTVNKPGGISASKTVELEPAP